MDFDYFYNREAERFNFLKVPEILVDGEEFKGLSAEAIILYSMLLKRTGMSFKNNWVDKEGRVFIYFTVEEIMRNGGKCIFQLRGVRPFLSDKFDITRHKNYKLLEDYDKKNVFDIERYIKRKGEVILNGSSIINRVDI